MVLGVKKTLSASAIAVAITSVSTGCTTSQQIKKEPLTLSHTWHASAAQGMTLRFSQAVESITWTFRGKTHTMKVRGEKSTVTIPVELPQGQKFSLTIDKAQGSGTEPLQKPVTLTGITKPALQVTTDPGIWQFDVPRTGPYTIKFSAPIADRDRMASAISFNPPIQGKFTWISNSEVQFVPDTPVPPTQTETMTIAGGKTGLYSESGQYLTASVKRPFITASNQKIVVKERRPETLTLYQNGKAVLKTPCNTGVTGAATPTGHFYIRAMVQKTEMKGQDPDGEKYDIPNVPWVMELFGNTAIHGYPRTQYGYPQSNGCVELPIATAKKLYQLVQVGTPVDIIN